MDITQLVIAIVSAPALTYLVRRWTNNKRTDKAIEAVHAEVRTNHGLSAGEYLERLDRLCTSLVEGQTLHARQLADHTRLDDERFAQLKSTLDLWYEEEPQETRTP